MSHDTRLRLNALCEKLRLAHARFDAAAARFEQRHAELRALMERVEAPREGDH